MLGRELRISTAQEVFRPDEHPTLDGVAASPTDAGRMLQAYIAAKLAGSANEFVRKHAKAALDLAVHLQPGHCYLARHGIVRRGYNFGREPHQR